MENMPIHSLPPVVSSNARLLILGSMPGVRSLEIGQYYAHPRNHFWPILSDILKLPLSAASYEKRLAAVTSHGIALWDVLATCLRVGSLDTDIKQGTPNDFAWLFSEYPSIEVVCFNGQAAGKLYKKLVGVQPDKQYIVLPSSSPAHTIPYDAKRIRWSVIAESL